MNDQYYDALLNIKTMEHKNFSQSLQYHRYEATPYEGLKQLFDIYPINKDARAVDYGCGKGRLNFFLHHFYRLKVLGVEMDEKLYQQALENKERYLKRHAGKPCDIEFYLGKAEYYEVKDDETLFYFFNPFSIQIFRRVVSNILRSIEKTKRVVDIILYYPHGDYIYFLENETAFELVYEVQFVPHYKHNENERFLVYRIQ